MATRRFKFPELTTDFKSVHDWLISLSENEGTIRLNFHSPLRKKINVASDFYSNLAINPTVWEH